MVVVAFDEAFFEALMLSVMLAILSFVICKPMSHETNTFMNAPKKMFQARPPAASKGRRCWTGMAIKLMSVMRVEMLKIVRIYTGMMTCGATKQISIQYNGVSFHVPNINNEAF